MCTCVYMFMCGAHSRGSVHSYGGTSICTCMWKLGDKSLVSPPEIPSTSLESGFLADWELPHLSRMTGQKAAGLLLAASPVLRLWYTWHFLPRFWGSNSGPHVCRTSTFPAELSPQPSCLCLITQNNTKTSMWFCIPENACKTYKEWWDEFWLIKYKYIAK